MKESPISPEDELFDSINSIVQGEHAHYINKLKPTILPLIQEFAQKKYQEGVKSVEGTFEQAYQEGEMNGRIQMAEAFQAIGRDNVSWGRYSSVPEKVLEVLPEYYRKSTVDIPRGKKEFMDFVVKTLKHWLTSVHRKPKKHGKSQLEKEEQ